MIVVMTCGMLGDGVIAVLATRLPICHLASHRFMGDGMHNTTFDIDPGEPSNISILLAIE